MIPARFCWSRFGVEAGEPVASILARKDAERGADGGIFLWGIGSSVGTRAIRALVDEEYAPEVLFSPIAGSPRLADVAPAAVVGWRRAVTLPGASIWDFRWEAFPLPEHAVVTSRASGRAHYALVCFSAAPLAVSGEEVTLDVGWVRNLVSGRPVGASQVTAVVTYKEASAAMGRVYPVAMQARLVHP
jgi:hypothetical protein